MSSALHASRAGTPIVEALESRLFLSTTNSFAASQISGEKPQSKLWFNEGHWWTVMPDSTGSWVRRLDGSSWNKVLKLSSSTSAKADVVAVGDVTHVLLYTGSSGTKLASIELVDGSTPTYQFWSERSSLTSVSLASGVEAATIDVDSNGRLWVAYDGSSQVYVRYSDGNYSSFSSSIQLASGIGSDDIAAISRVGDDQIGVFWSNQNTKRFGFKIHNDDASASSWGSTETPGGSNALNVGNGQADDHIHLATNESGELFAAVKTSYDSSSQASIGLIKRSSGGSWSKLYTVDTKGTRPTIQIDDDSNMLTIAYTDSNTSAASIVYKQSSTSSISFGSKKTLISGSWNNVSTSKHTVNGQFAFIATNSSGSTAKAGLLGSSNSAATSSSRSSTFSTRQISWTNAATASETENLVKQALA